jgi:poly(3-hydroxybutyrate) depolymerase
MIRPAIWLPTLLVLCLAGCADQSVNVAGTQLDLYTYRPPGCKPQVVLLVFHGQSRNAWSYRDATRFLTDRFCGFVVAPEFDAVRFPPRELYEFGRVTKEAPGHRTIDLVPPLVAWVRNAVDAPSLPFVLLGHSSGGQIVSRVAAFLSTGAAGIIVANPSTWVLPGTTIAAPYGLGGTKAATDDALRAYLARPVTVLGDAQQLANHKVSTWRARSLGVPCAVGWISSCAIHRFFGLRRRLGAEVGGRRKSLSTLQMKR